MTRTAGPVARRFSYPVMACNCLVDAEPRVGSAAWAGMSTTDSADALLTVALQDLRAGIDMLVERLSDIGKAAEGEALRQAIESLIEEAGRAATELAATGRAEGGPENLWMKGILDDAERDTGSVAAGPLLDTAIIGALRKGLAAAGAAYDTALALARALGEVGLADALTRLKERDVAANANLAELLKPRAAATVPDTDG